MFFLAVCNWIKENLYGVATLIAEPSPAIFTTLYARPVFLDKNVRLGVTAYLDGTAKPPTILNQRCNLKTL